MSKKQKREKMAKYLESAKSEFQSLSNFDLLVEVIYLSSGDDYDNCFTTRGAAIYDAAKEELKTRLVKVGFLTEEDDNIKKLEKNE